ncbi:MAG: bifunctional UDP-N-acetylglucosamine diphosphorylase/glucosamine-1-phosphate N-acetyltransferase GlmU [Nitriliruptoraceae bacterium]
MNTVTHPELAVVVLAAGQGTRFRSEVAKVLHRAAGYTLVRHVLEAARPLAAGRTVVVVGHQAAQVQAEVEAAGIEGLVVVEQGEQRGTGHAVQQALPALGDARWVLVLYGDTPLLTSESLAELAAADDGVPVRMLTTVLDNPAGYGRVLRNSDGQVERIVEDADADASERAITELNAGMYLVRRDVLESALSRIEPRNAQGELYLTDVVGVARSDGHAVTAVTASAETVSGVNDRQQLAAAAAVLRARHLTHLMVEVGVTVVDPTTTHVDVDVQVGRDSVILPGTMLEQGTRIGERVTVGPHSHLTACAVADDATIHSTRAEQAQIGPRAVVGPFAHLRPGTVMAASTKIGSFVETKKLELGEGSKIPHLAYIGDATLGKGVNIACGVVTVNYDGRDKHHTTVEDGAFVGCDTMLVAPVTIGERAYTAAGSTITEDVPAGALAIARSRQTNKDGWVERSAPADRG